MEWFEFPCLTCGESNSVGQEEVEEWEVIFQEKVDSVAVFI